jgi:hypothetical protein
MQATSPSAARGCIAVPPGTKLPPGVDVNNLQAVLRAVYNPHGLLVHQLRRAAAHLANVNIRMNVKGRINVKNNIRLAEAEWKRDLPYCIERVESGAYIVLNRYYKPLALVGDDHLDYHRDPAYSVFCLHRSQVNASALRMLTDDDSYLGWFYDGVTAPWLGVRARDKYLERFHSALGHLLTLPTMDY